MKLIFERGDPGQHMTLLPECDVPEVSLKERRALPLRLPHVSENELTRHYKQLSDRVHGVNDGFYPLGSCTMKYNPKIDEELAALPGFTRLHPLQGDAASQGALEVLWRMEQALGTITGMDGVTLQPAAGAHGEFTGLLLIKAYHTARKDSLRTKIIVPDSAHGTNPASARMAGFDVVNIPSGPDGCVDLTALRAAVGPDTAGLMLTNPNTVGIFDKNILKITEIVHAAGGLCYYDGANLNAVVGVVRPGDMGFDVCHLNLHKTFAAPHGGGGPGSGPVCCKEALCRFLPGPVAEKHGEKFRFVTPRNSIGRVRGFAGNFTVIVKSLAYILTLGREQLPQAAENAVLNANYMMARLAKNYEMAYHEFCMHEFVMTLDQLHQKTGVSAMDIAKGLLDSGIHPPTMYFPLIVHEALMIEPCETESKETMDEVCAVFEALRKEAETDPQALHDAPKHTPVRRLDEVEAARHPIVRYQFQQD
jgi:Glycine cleavage system protein P (pyridoxal-binding), C-terminal domain